VLWKLRDRPWPRWRRFGLYLVLAGVERFLAEIWRTNPRVTFGLTQAQVVSIILFAIGMGLFLRRSARRSVTPNPAAPAPLR
jgi:phosphatidylglycerol:prolipoprotein diacylglycerol transferase